MREVYGWTLQELTFLGVVVFVACCVGAACGAAAIGVVMAYRGTAGIPPALRETKQAPDPQPPATDPHRHNDLYDVAIGIPMGGMDGLDALHATAGTRHEFRRMAGTDFDLGGVSHVSPATTIHWRSESAIDTEGASVRAVLEAAALRLESIQKTPQARDANARALWSVLKALAALEETKP